MYMTQMDTVSSDEGNTKNPRSRKKELRSRCWTGTAWVENGWSWTQLAQILGSLDGEPEYICQMERCPTTGKEHFHLGIYFKNPRGIAFQNEFPGKNIHWEVGRNWRNVKNYCSKRLTRISGPWTNIKGLTFRQTIRDPMKNLIWRDWQKEIRDIIIGEVDERKVYWYWEPNGGVGKSCFTKHICMNYNAMVSGGTKKDVLYGIREFDRERDLQIVIFDICRSSFNHVSYKAIEDIKNGCFYASKYESGMVLINSPHVIVFANYPPDCSQLSEDRWVVQRI